MDDSDEPQADFVLSTILRSALSYGV